MQQKLSPKVSVIIPVYNAQQYLERCLDSICSQTLKDIEIICVDDCSNDNSLKILNKYSSKDNRIKVIAHDVNGGESKARNTGLGNSTGEYLAFVDNDDTIDIDFLEKLYTKGKETEADIVKACTHIYNYNGSETFDNSNEKIKQYNSKLYFKSYWWSAIYKRELVKDLKFLEGYPLGGDVLFLNQAILKANKLELVDDTFYNYFRREDSGDSRILTFEKVKSALEIHEIILDNVIKSNLKDTKGVEHICLWSITNALNYAYRNRTVKNLEYCINKLITFYTKSKNYITEDKLTNFLPVTLHYLKLGDEQKLVNLFLTYDTPQKMLIANIRYLHSKKG